MDEMGLVAYTDGHGKPYWWRRSDQEKLCLDDHLFAHELVSRTLAPGVAGSDPLDIDCAIFRVPRHGFRVWVNVSDAWTKLAFDQVATGAVAFQKYVQRWQALAQTVGLPAMAIRRSIEKDTTKAWGHDDVDNAPPDRSHPDRVLLFVSVSLGYLLMHSTRGAFGQNANEGASEKDTLKGGYRRLALGLLGQLPQNFTIEMRMDASARRVAAEQPFAGINPFTITVQDGIVLLDGFKEAWKSVKEDVRTWELDSMTVSGFHEQRFKEFFSYLMRKAGVVTGRRRCSGGMGLGNSMAGQVLCYVTDVLEKKFCDGCALSDIFGEELATGDVVAGNRKCYYPGNAHQTLRELGHYIRCAKHEFKNANIISISGPDCTKIGTDLNISMMYVMNCETGKIAVATPQVMR